MLHNFDRALATVVTRLACGKSRAHGGQKNVIHPYQSPCVRNSNHPLTQKPAYLVETSANINDGMLVLHIQNQDVMASHLRTSPAQPHFHI